jgi:hypothetical protein
MIISRDGILKSRPQGNWGYTPRLAYEPGKDYSGFFDKVLEERKEKVMKAIKFVFKHCSSSSDKLSNKVPPLEWETAYDMRHWLEFPRLK